MRSVPEGHPGTLRSAAYRFQATAEQMQSHAATVGLSVVAEVATWRGWASLVHGALAARLARDLSTAPHAFAEAASALTALADALEEAQQEAGQVLAQIDEAEGVIASLERARASQGGPGMQLLAFELGDHRTRLAGLTGTLAAIEAKAKKAREDAAERFEDVSALAPMVRQARGGDARLGAHDYARDPRLALLIDVIAEAGGASTPEELRAILSELSADDLALVLEAAPGLAMMLAETGLPQSARTGSLEARLLAALDTSCDPEDKIAGIARFFAQLSEEETMRLALLYPTVVGNLNGAPLHARIAANRVHMVGERARVQLRIEQMQERHAELIDAIASDDTGSPGTTDGWRLAQEVGILQDQIDAHRERLKVLSGFLDQTVQNPLYRLVPGAPERSARQFLVFDPRGDGLIAELHGIIGDRTRDLGILVPGTGADLLGFEALARRGASFSRASYDGSLATITWLGYDAPNSIAGDAPFNDYADVGGPALRDFVTGLGLDEEIDVTVVGHSYGGAVVGAAEREGMVADNVVHVASAGASVDDISDYPNEARRYSLTGPADPIKIAQGNSRWIPGRPENIGHGLDPDAIPGVTRLETGRVDATAPTSDAIRGLSAHTDVLDLERSDSWRNIYNVMVGGGVTLYEGPTGVGFEVVDGGIVGGIIVPQIEHGMDDPDYVPPIMDVP